MSVIPVSTLPLLGREIDSNRVVFGHLFYERFDPENIIQGRFEGTSGVEYPYGSYSVAVSTNDTLNITVFRDTGNFLIFYDGRDYRIRYDEYQLFVLEREPRGEYIVLTSFLPEIQDYYNAYSIEYLITIAPPVTTGDFISATIGGRDNYEFVGGYWSFTIVSLSQVRVTIIVARNPPFILTRDAAAIRYFAFDVNQYPEIIFKLRNETASRSNFASINNPCNPNCF